MQEDGSAALFTGLMELFVCKFGEQLQACGTIYTQQYRKIYAL
jgi:hypothetical protein